VSNGSRRPTIVTNSETADKQSSILTKRQIGNSILEMYTALLCEKGNYATIRKFGKTVTSKVCYLSKGAEDVADFDSGFYIF